MEVEVAGAWAWVRELERGAGGNCVQQNRAGSTQRSSSNRTMARVLVLAATAAALRPTLPRRTRTAPRAALTMHDYDYDVARCVEINCNALMGLTD